MEEELKVFLDKYVNPLKKYRSLDRLKLRRKSSIKSNIITAIGLQKLILLLGPFFEKKAIEVVRSKVTWNEEEECVQMRHTEKGTGSPIWDVILSRLRRSIAGQFIEEFNKDSHWPQEDKELILELAKLSKQNKEENRFMERENDFVDDISALLKKIIIFKKDGPITLATFFRHLTHLRLCDSKIGRLGAELRQLDTLQVLMLSGNTIEELPVGYLPPHLNVLELYDNLICHIPAGEGTPPPLVYLGLSTNCFLHSSVMDGLATLKTLSVLDLSDNDIIKISEILPQIAKASGLRSLCLRGNPCSTMMSYKEMVKAAIPHLEQLDGVIFSKSEEDLITPQGSRNNSIIKQKNIKLYSTLLLYNTAELRIYIFRMMGIAKPTTKLLKGKTYFHFEVELPLLDDRLRVREQCRFILDLLKKCEVIPNTDSMAQVLPTTESLLKNTESGFPNTGNNKNDSKYEKPKENWEVKYKRFLSEDREIEGGKKIVSEKINWAPVMKPTNAILALPVEVNALIRLRDTLRTIIIIRLYSNEEGINLEGQTTSHKKLIAKISVPSEVPHWNEQYCGYEWNAKNPQIAQFFPNISYIKLAAGQRGIQRKKSCIVFPAPNFPTCHLGISLLRMSN